MVVAFALAGCMGMDFKTDPLGNAPDGTPVFLADVYPTDEEIADAVEKSKALSPETYQRCYENVFQSNEAWNSIPTQPSELFAWNETSTYIQKPPFLEMDEYASAASLVLPPCARSNAKTTRRAKVSLLTGGVVRCLAVLGDSVTTDHISPAGSIKPDSPAGNFLAASGVSPKDFNSYGARRGNDRVMTRGTFANIRIRNALVPGEEGGVTKFLPTGDVMPIYTAAMRYREQDIPLMILAGAEYGTGSSRDWAAKGTALLGVKAVIARSFERIHRGNLIGMGVLPLEFVHGASVESLNLTGEEEFTLPVVDSDFTPGGIMSVVASKPVVMDGREMLSETEFQVKVRIDTPVELQYYLNGGILPTVMNMLSE